MYIVLLNIVSFIDVNLFVYGCGSSIVLADVSQF